MTEQLAGAPTGQSWNEFVKSLPNRQLAATYNSLSVGGAYGLCKIAAGDEIIYRFCQLNTQED